MRRCRKNGQTLARQRELADVSRGACGSPAAASTELHTMLFRLSRVSFWLAAAVAALALLAPGGHETLLTGVALAASAAAFGLWRSAVSAQRRSHAAVTAVPEAIVLTTTSLLDAAVLLVRKADAAASFDAALHAVAHVLRGELGARRVVVRQVRRVDATHAKVADLIEAQPGFQARPQPVRLDAGPLGQAIRTQLEAGKPPGAVAMPVLSAGRVVAVIELSGIDVPVEPQALMALLQLARLTLSRLAAASAWPRREPVAVDRLRPNLASVPCGREIQAHPAPHLHGHVLVVEDTIVQPELTARMLRRAGCRVTQASGMLAGLQVLCETQFDLILIDIEMSGLGVAEGLQWLRRGGAAGAATTSDTPVIAVTGPGLPVDTQRLRELGFDDHVCKPFRQSQMLALLKQHLRPHAPAEFRQSTGAPLPEPSTDAVPAGPASVLDPVALARLTELDPTGANRLLARVLQAFQTSVARLRPQADAARISGDQAALRLVAHTLKSSSASIGAMHLSQLCAQIEAMIRGGSVDDLDAQLDALGAALDQVLTAIEQLLKERT